MTSMVSRGRVFLLALDIDAHCVNSVAIDITRKLTEVVFQEKGNRSASKDGTHHRRHNILLDCHKEAVQAVQAFRPIRSSLLSLCHLSQPAAGKNNHQQNHAYNNTTKDLLATFKTFRCSMTVT
jgi:hypothetical protein